MVEAEQRDKEAQHGIDDVVGTELSSGNRKLGVDGLSEEEIQFPGANEFRKVGKVDVKDGLEKLGDELVGADEGNDVPAGPVADGFGVAEESVDEENLAAEPEEFDEGPEEEVCLEAHFPNEGVAEQQEVDLKVSAEGRHWLQHKGDTRFFECLFFIREPTFGKGVKASLRFKRRDERVGGGEEGGIVFLESDCPFFDAER